MGKEVTLLVFLILANLGHLLNHIVLVVFINHCAKPEYIVNTTPVQKQDTWYIEYMDYRSLLGEQIAEVKNQYLLR